eukprot:12901169-Alexandrium_andersonii.AAC.1
MCIRDSSGKGGKDSGKGSAADSSAGSSQDVQRRAEWLKDLGGARSMAVNVRNGARRLKTTCWTARPIAKDCADCGFRGLRIGVRYFSI